MKNWKATGYGRIEDEKGTVVGDAYGRDKIANAQLMAAAPKMLQALVDAEYVIKGMNNGNCLVTVLDALKEARGEK